MKQILLLLVLLVAGCSAPKTTDDVDHSGVYKIRGFKGYDTKCTVVADDLNRKERCYFIIQYDGAYHIPSTGEIWRVEFIEGRNQFTQKESK